MSKRRSTKSEASVSSNLPALRSTPARPGFLDRMRAIVRAATTGEVARYDMNGLRQFFEASFGTSSGAVVNEHTAMSVGTVFACVRIISQALASVDFRVFEIEGDRERIAADHDVDKAINVQPNRWQTPYEFKQLIGAHLMLRGNFYALVVRSRRQVIAILPLHPDRMRVEQIDDFRLIYHYDRANGLREQFSQFEIMHLRGVSSDGVVGLSPITMAAESIGLQMQARKHGARLFANAARPSGVFKHTGALSDEAHARLKKQLEEWYAGVDNAHRVILLEDGMDWQSVGLSPEEGQFLETRKFERSEIAMWFGVPPHMLGDVDKTTSWGSGIEEQGIGFVRNVLRPILTNVAQGMRRDLIQGDQKQRYAIRYDTEQLERGTLKQQAEAYSVLRQIGVMSPNEIRKRLGMNPRKDSGGDRFATQANMAPDDGGETEEGNATDQGS